MSKEEKIFVDGDSRVLTNNGFFNIKDLEGEKVRVADVEESLTEVYIGSKIVENGVFTKVFSRLGNSIICSTNTVFLGVKQDYRHKTHKLEDLTIKTLMTDSNIRFVKFQSPCLGSDLIFDEDSHINGMNSKKNYKKDKGNPFFNQLFSIKDRIQWLEGLFNHSGNLIVKEEKGKKYCTIMLTGNPSFLESVIELLKTLGIQASFRESRLGIIIPHFYLLKLRDLGFKWKEDNLNYLQSVYNRTKFDSPVKVTKEVFHNKKFYYLETEEKGISYVFVNNIPIKLNNKY